MIIKGFTSIELLIILAILSLYFSTVYHVYHDCHKKSYIIEGISFTDGIQSKMEKYFSEKDVWPNTNQINKTHSSS